ncbi:MAG: hypothetical protein J6N52_12330 [Clostridia bacterium]|nr:hypothetical protein [Clostridia bacterium]
MYYLMITASALFFSMQFMFNNGYQRHNGTGWEATLKFSFYTALAGFFIILAVNKFRIAISQFSLLTAFVYGAVCIMLNYSTIKAFEYAGLSVYSIFSMIGGMMLPFIYGLLCGEEFKLIRLICCALIAISVFLTVDNKQSKKAFCCYIAVFLLNGMVGVISKFHQSYADYCVDSGSFLMLTRIVITIFCFILMLKEKRFALSRKSLSYCVGYAGLNCIGNLMLLIALLHLPASVQYPMVTGGTIVFSVIIDLIRRVRITKKEMAAAGISLAASCLMAL